MPNYCCNDITITGPDEDLKRLLEAAAYNPPPGSADDPLIVSLEKLLPTPPDCNNREDWRRQHWGTKWDFASTFDACKAEGVFCCSADTAWNPPLAALEAISRHYPTLTFDIDYREPGNGLYGSETYHQGQAT